MDFTTYLTQYEYVHEPLAEETDFCDAEDMSRVCIRLCESMGLTNVMGQIIPFLPTRGYLELRNPAFLISGPYLNSYTDFADNIDERYPSLLFHLEKGQGDFLNAHYSELTIEKISKRLFGFMERLAEIDRLKDINWNGNIPEGDIPF